MHFDDFFQNLLDSPYVLNSAVVSPFLYFTGFSFLLQITSVLMLIPMILTQLLLLLLYNSLSLFIWCNIGILFCITFILKNYIFMCFCPASQLNFNSQRQNSLYLFHFFLPPIWYLVSGKYSLKVLMFIEYATSIIVYHMIEDL